ncbi:MAG: CYTH domain-containing protein, partial [Planctomycetes bacterium]|nr:CYTH domain-containing protein [Planctomycetota bacterium]
MDHHLEVELKWALTPDGHARLANALPALLGAARLLVQENRFFDSADLRLRRARMNLRLRRENDQLQLTCK